MSVITNNIGMARSLTVDMLDTPLDGRTRVTSVEDFPNIEHPFVGMVIYCTDTPNKLYLVTKLKDKLMGAIPVPNAVIDTYIVYQRYSQGTGISISADGVISCTVPPSGGGGTTDYNALVNTPKFYKGRGITLDAITAGSIIVSGAGDTATNGIYDMVDATAVGIDRVWQKTDRKLYHDGTKWVFDDDTDSSNFYYSATGDGEPWNMTFTASISSLGSAPTVTRRDNSMTSKYTFAIDTSLVALKSDITNYSEGANITISPAGVISAVDTTYTGNDGISLNGTVFSIDWTKVAKATDVKTYSGTDGISLNGTVFSIDWTKVAKKGEGTTYTQGDGISITTDNKINIKGVTVITGTVAEDYSGLYIDSEGLKFADTKYALKSDIKTYSNGEGLSLNGTEFAVDFTKVASAKNLATLAQHVGAIDDMLDMINGEEI